MAAITGASNLIASGVCRDFGALYEYVTTRISAVAGVRQLAISPVLSRLKQAGPLMGASTWPRHGRRDTTAHSRAVSRVAAATGGASGCARHTHVRYDQ